MIHLPDFLAERSASDAGQCANDTEAYQFLAECSDEIDYVTYTKKDEFLVTGIDVFKKDTDGCWYYEYAVDRRADLISDIRCSNESIDLLVVVNSSRIRAQDLDLYSLASAPYTVLLIRARFREKPKADDTFTVSAKYYLLKPKDRQQLLNDVTTKKCSFKNGVCAELRQ